MRFRAFKATLISLSRRMSGATRTVLLFTGLFIIAEVAHARQAAVIHSHPDVEKSMVSSEELVIFARFHAIEGKEESVATELRETVARVRVEPGCISIQAYRSVQDPRLFWLHARWTNEAAFDAHARLPATIQFVERAERLIDHPFDVSRARALE